MNEPLDASTRTMEDIGRRGRAVMRRGAEDQAAAYEALLAQWADVDPELDEREWQQVKRQLQETRRSLGQRLLFPE